MRIVINEELAKTAQDMTSFNDYKVGSTTAAYIAACEEVEKIIEKTEEKYQDQIIKLVDRYTTKLGNWYNNYNANKAKYPSWFISGPANYNMRKHNQQQSREKTLLAEYEEIQALRKKILNFRPKLTHADYREKQDIELEKMTNLLEDMKKINKHYRKYKNLDDVADVQESSIQLARKNKEFQTRAYHRDTTDWAPFQTFELTNLRAKIKRREANKAKEEARQEAVKNNKEKTIIKEFEGIKVVENIEIDRLQIIFDEIPSPEIRAELKQNGFRWSPTNKAWQRQLTNNAKYAAKRFLGRLKNDNR